MTSRKQTQLNDKELTVALRDFKKDLNSYAYYKLHDSAKGEDLVQDTFTKTWIYLVKGGKIILMRAFLYHVLNNLIVDEYRKQNHKSESLDFLLEKGFEPKDEQSERLINFLDGREMMQHISELPLNYKTIMHMRFSESMSLKDISAIIGQTKNSIAVKIHRGMQKLKVLCGYKLSLIN
jgi:RNA polymerase sigma-70 factor (ECF subfamily)